MFAALGCGGGSAPSPKVLVIGLDGATWDLLDPWMAQGHLPNLQALRDGGAHGPLLSVLPALSPPAWTSAVTGVNPGAHGIYDFLRLDPESMVAYQETAESRRVPALWTLLSESEHRVGILNVPMTDPPDPVNGFMVAGLPHTDQVDYTHPPELEARLQQDAYLLDRMGGALIEDHEGDLLQEIMETFRRRRDVALALGSENPDLDLYWVVFTGTDRIQHYFWKFMETDHPFHDEELAGTYGNAILNLWKETDAAVGALVEQTRAQADAAGRELAVLVVSDHGFTGVHRAFRPQSFLKNPPDGSAPINQAYSLETNASLLSVPVQGRESTATLTQGEQDAMVDEIHRRIMAVRDPEGGECPVAFGSRREDLYEGRYVSKAPDLVFLPKPPYYLVSEEGDKEPFGTPSLSFSGHHTIQGILIAAGPMFRAGRLEGRQSLLDIAPTVLHLAGDVVPGYMEGSSLSGILTDAFLAAHPVRVDQSTAREIGGETANPVLAIPYLN